MVAMARKKRTPQSWAVVIGVNGYHESLGALRYCVADAKRVADVLSRMAASPIMQALNDGNPYAMGESIGITDAVGRTRANELGNVCLWCDEFFRDHFDLSDYAARPGSDSSSQRMFNLPVIDKKT